MENSVRVVTDGVSELVARERVARKRELIVAAWSVGAIPSIRGPWLSPTLDFQRRGDHG
jgi:hypothetical protein